MRTELLLRAARTGDLNYVRSSIDDSNDAVCWLNRSLGATDVLLEHPRGRSLTSSDASVYRWACDAYDPSTAKTASIVKLPGGDCYLTRLNESYMISGGRCKPYSRLATITEPILWHRITLMDLGPKYGLKNRERNRRYIEWRCSPMEIYSDGYSHADVLAAKVGYIVVTSHYMSKLILELSDRYMVFDRFLDIFAKGDNIVKVKTDDR